MGDWCYQCKPCKLASVAQIKAAQKRDPEKATRNRAMYARLQREWRARNVERVRERRAVEYQRLREDPARWATYRENARIQYRLKAEKAGRRLKDVRGNREVLRIPAERQVRRLPAEPFVAFVESCIEDARVRERCMDPEGRERPGVVGRVCRELGLSERAYRRIKSGKRVSVGLVERVLMEAGIPMEDLWGEMVAA
jgi:hypothetical protein